MSQDAILQLVDIAATALATMAAAFAGSWWAFRLTDRANARQTIQQQIASINRAQFILVQQLNMLVNVEQQSIAAVRHHPARFIAMRAHLPFSGGPYRLDVDSLLFLLETTDHEFLFRVVLEQQRFDAVLQALNERSRLHLEVLQPKLTTAGIRERVDYSRDALIAALGEEFVVRLQRLTDDVISQTDQTIASCTSLIAEFHRAMKIRFPKHRIIKAQPESALASRSA